MAVTPMTATVSTQSDDEALGLRWYLRQKQIAAQAAYDAAAAVKAIDPNADDPTPVPTIDELNAQLHQQFASQAYASYAQQRQAAIDAQKVVELNNAAGTDTQADIIARATAAIDNA